MDGIGSRRIIWNKGLEMPSIERLELALQREHEARKIAEDLLENKPRSLYLAYQALLEKNKELDLLFSLLKMSDKHKETEQILEYYINAVCKSCGWGVGHIYWVSEADGKPQLAPSPIWYLSSEDKFQSFVDATSKTYLDAGMGLPGRVYEKQKAAWVENIDTAPNFSRSKPCFESGLQTCFAVPISCAGEIIAVAEFYSEQKTAKNEYLLKILETTTIQMNMLLEQRLSNEKIKNNYTKLQATHTELQSTQNQLVQSSKLASIGQLAAGVAHEINNPIAFVTSNTNSTKKYMAAITLFLAQQKEFLAAQPAQVNLADITDKIAALYKEHKLDFILEDVIELIDDSVEGLERVTGIVAGLKGYARVDAGVEEKVDVESILDTTVKMLWNEIKYKCVIDKHYAGIPAIAGNKGQIQQVFTNLITNAGHAIEADGVITLSTEQIGNEVLITVKDTGDGIDKKNFDKLFEPFFTTKEVGKGTGLGLSISHGIIEKHGGSINVESTVGTGTTFFVRLPVKANSDDSSQSED